ncbi:LOW QUALITY PROTEIN: E3 ubiquitin-protein ligase MARCHF4 [Osmerus eperlanus]|uniref:LOW QUALITY PROTEIN: E3 ubiquitin-protein ligase MARCHF4 n=1 Tax=Osmerus eperlanus TaxID=29151 RepID=UPI002E13CCC3
MNGQNNESNATGNAANTNDSTAAPAPPAAGSAGTDQPKVVEDWPATGQAGPLDYGSSSEDCSKEKFDEGMSVNSCTDSGSRTPLCRICFQGPEQGELLSPCRCSGSVRCTHELCLIKWISERGSWSCELCYYKYHVIAISAKNPLQWQAISLTVIERVQIAAAVLGDLFLVASISWLVWSSISPSARWQRQDLLFQICYAMYGFMDLVCIALIIHEGPSVFRIFNRWQAVNQQWKVLNYDKTKDTEDHQKYGPTPRPPALLNPRNAASSGAGLGDDPASPSTSSLMAAVAAHALGAAATASTATTQDSLSERSNGQASSLTDRRHHHPYHHHCPYNLLHLLSHFRQQAPRVAQIQPQVLAQVPAEPSEGSRELVMRVTTV